jgi:hypothetical protein
MRRRHVLRIFSALLAACVTVLGAEIAVRLLEPQRTAFTGRGLFTPDADLGHVLRPGLPDGGYRTNSFGFRDQEYALEKPIGVYRIVNLGDSFTFGGAGAAEEVYGELLERRFAEVRRSTRVEVINTGVPGYNTVQEMGHFRKFSRSFQPDLVLVGLFIGGDILENLEPFHFRVVDGELAPLDRMPSLWERWLKRSHLYRILWRVRLRHARADAVVTAERALSTFLGCEAARLPVCKVAPSQEVVEAYDVTMKLLLELREDVRSAGADLLVLLVPDEVQVNPDVFRMVCERFSLDPSDFDLDLPNRRLLDFFEREGIWAVDVLQECRAQHRESPVYVALDTHWNVRGHEIAARALFEAIRSRVEVLR